jgi:hypothetical protein
MFLGLLDPDPIVTDTDPDQAKILGLLFDFLSLKNDVSLPSKRNKQKNLKKLVFCWHLEGQ